MIKFEIKITKRIDRLRGIIDYAIKNKIEHQVKYDIIENDLWYLERKSNDLLYQKQQKIRNLNIKLECIERDIKERKRIEIERRKIEKVRAERSKIKAGIIKGSKKRSLVVPHKMQPSGRTRWQSCRAGVFKQDKQYYS